MLVWQCHKPSHIHHHFYGWESNHQKWVVYHCYIYITSNSNPIIHPHHGIIVTLYITIFIMSWMNSHCHIRRIRLMIRLK